MVTNVEVLRISELAFQCHLHTDYDGTHAAQFVYMGLIKQMEEDQTYFEVMSNELATDMEDDLTDYLQQQGIPYNIRCDAKYEYGAELRWWRPRMKREDSWCYMDHEAKVTMISLHALEVALLRRTKLETVVKRLRKIPPKMDEAIIVDGKRSTTRGSGKTVDSRKVKS